jgi:hypothetical protein
MATDGPRRSGRTRKPVKSYADEQADDQDIAVPKPGPKRTTKRKRKVEAQDDEDDGEFEQDVEQPANKAPKRTVKKGKNLFFPG